MRRSTSSLGDEALWRAIRGLQLSVAILSVAIVVLAATLALSS